MLFVRYAIIDFSTFLKSPIRTLQPTMFLFEIIEQIDKKIIHTWLIPFCNLECKACHNKIRYYYLSKKKAPKGLKVLI